MTESLKLKAKTYRCRFLEAGICGYGKEKVFIKPDKLMDFLPSFKGLPVVIGHVYPDGDDQKKQIVGYISSVEHFDNWLWANFVITDEEAYGLIKDKGYSVSCSYVPIRKGMPGKYHGIDYDFEVLDVEGKHLALVSNPRYEEAEIYENSINNKNKGNKMNLFKLKKEPIENSADHVVDIDGEMVSLETVVKAYENQAEQKKEEKAKTVSPDDTYEVDGKKVKVKEMINAYKNACKKNENQDDSEKDAKKDDKENQEDGDKEKEKGDKEVKTKEEENQDDSEKEKDEKKENSDDTSDEHAKALENAMRKANSKKETRKEKEYRTKAEKIELGKQRY